MNKKTKKWKSHSPVGFYWRKASFFGFIFFATVFILSGVKYFSADYSGIDSSETSSADLKIAVEVEKDGSIKVDGEEITDKVKLVGNYAEVRLPIIDNQQYYYENAEIDLILPEPVSDQTAKDILGIHGVGNVSSSVLDSRTISYKAEDVAAGATVSIIAKLPKDAIDFPLSVSFLNLLLNIKANAWIILGIILPVLTMLYMFFFTVYKIKRQKIDIPTEETDTPPMALPPALVGVLYRQKVGPREIAATLVDLAVRGDIYILDRERDFAFLKNRFDKRLLPYEKILLLKIFHEHLVTSREDIEEDNDAHLYSKKISMLSADIYNLATRLGYFSVNPRKIHLKYQLIGIGGFFGGLAGFLGSLWLFDTPSYIAFFWVGMMISSVVITMLSTTIPQRTLLGQENLSNWLAFKKYLSSPEKLPFSYDSEDLFFQFLPYAIVLDSEVLWAKRFSEHAFMIPEWFVSDKDGMGLQDFCLSLFPIVSFVSRSLSTLKEPGFE